MRWSLYDVSYIFFHLFFTSFIWQRSNLTFCKISKTICSFWSPSFWMNVWQYGCKGYSWEIVNHSQSQRASHVEMFSIYFCISSYLQRLKRIKISETDQGWLIDNRCGSYPGSEPEKIFGVYVSTTKPSESSVVVSDISRKEKDRYSEITQTFLGLQSTSTSYKIERHFSWNLYQPLFKNFCFLEPWGKVEVRAQSV